MSQRKAEQLHREIQACELCDAHLPRGPRPVTQFSVRSRIVVVGQAPGTKVHETGVAWNDASGDHLRDWLRVPREVFYDPDSFALVPMGFCYPGKANGGDAPPRPECAVTWHARVFEAIEPEPLILLCGQYAVRHYLGPSRRKTLTETVRSFDDFAPRFFPLPHPSWRSRIWIKKNPWFETEVLPALRARIQVHLNAAEHPPLDATGVAKS